MPSKVSKSPCWCIFSLVFIGLYKTALDHQKIEIDFDKTILDKNSPPNSVTSQFNTTGDKITVDEYAEEEINEKRWFKVKDYLPVEEKPCQFPQWSTSSPLPVILISRGRSGSSVIWDAIGKILGQPSELYEMTGGNITKSQIFFDSKIPPHIGNNWPIIAQCNAQRLYPKTSISGFQWKPFRATFNHALSEGGLEALGKYQSNHDSSSPPIKVIFNHRNRLDRIVSNKKHLDKDATSAHCAVDDEDCINTHKALAKRGIEIPLDNLLSDLEEDERNKEEIQKKLKEYNVDYISVDYEKLFSTEDASEWVRIFRYLNRGPVEDLTMEHIQDSLSFACTSTSRNETISNYQSVKDHLTGTKFEYLLVE